MTAHIIQNMYYIFLTQRRFVELTSEILERLKKNLIMSTMYKKGLVLYKVIRIILKQNILKNLYMEVYFQKNRKKNQL